VTIEFWATYFNSNPTWTRTFAFGDQNAGNENTGVDYCHYAPGSWQNLNIQSPSANGYANNPGGLNGFTNVHVTVVVDPPHTNMYYYNATTFLPTLHGGVPALNTINDTTCLLGKSLFDADSPVMGSLNEFRIYQGVISLSQLALNDAAGPDLIVTNPGPVQALHFSSPVNPLLVNQSSQQILRGDFTNLTGVDLIAYGGATFASSNTSILTINTNGVVKAISPGTTKVVAVFGGLSATNSLTVVSVPATLAHRYSFTNDASDSVGGANGTVMGTASVTGGQLMLDGNTGSYLDLPGGIINLATNAAVTFETWVTFGDLRNWAYLFGFGNTNGTGGGVGQIACVPDAEQNGFRHWGITENFNGGRTLGWSHPLSNITTHITFVVDPPDSTLSIYRDGVLEVAEYDAAAAIANVPTNYGFLGRSFYDADPYLIASIDEFRIYSGALSPAQVAMAHKSGPNSAAFDPGALSSIVVAPTNYPAYATLVPPVIFANYANLSNFNLVATVTAGGNATLGGPLGLVVTSSDPTIISVNSQNMLTTYRPGTVTLSATYGGKSSSATVTVKNLAVLAHRYSFNTDNDASDSVGGANGTLQGSATVSGGALQLPNGVNTDYLDLPPGLLNNYKSVTVDTWVNFGAAQHWARLWEFCDVAGGTENGFYFAPGWDPTPDANVYNAGFPWGNGVTVGGALQNASLHVTCVYGDGRMQVYTNAVLEGSTTVVAPANSAGWVSSTIGHSPYNDPGIVGSVDEFRIYNGRLAPDEIVASDVIGPNASLSTSASVTAKRSGSNIVLSWPVAAAGFSVQSRSNLITGSWTTLTNAPTLVGNTWQVSFPASSAVQFYRIWR